MCVVCAGVSGKPSRKRLKEKEAVSPKWKGRLLCNVWHPRTHSSAFVGSCSLSFGSFPTLLKYVYSPTDLHSPWAAQNLPRSLPWVGPGDCWCCTRAEEQQAGTLKSAVTSLGAQSHLRCWTVFWMRCERAHWGLVIYLFFLRLTHKESPFYGCLKQLISHLFFALLAAISGTSWRYAAVSICHWFTGHKEIVNLN